MCGIFEHSDIFKSCFIEQIGSVIFSINVIVDVEGGVAVAVGVCYNDSVVRRWHVLCLRATAHDWPWTACDGK